MVNYAVTDWSSSVGSVSDVLAEMEVQIETIDDTKTIRGIGIVPVGSSMAQGWLIYDA